MARRKQLKGIAGNLAQWVLSRNFDYNGYWAVGQLYADAGANETDEVTLNLVENFVSNDAVGVKFSEAILLLSSIFNRDIKSLKIPDWWVKVVFKFNTEYQHKYHCWGSALGGKPFMCVVIVVTDQGKKYSKKLGCNVWVHNPKKELRRYGF
jgi:hypothetical protein